MGPHNYKKYCEKGKQKANEIVREMLNDKQNLRCVSDEYPYSLYDYEYSENGEKKFVIVKYTATNVVHFSLSKMKIQFLRDFSNDAIMYLG